MTVHNTNKLKTMFYLRFYKQNKRVSTHYSNQTTNIDNVIYPIIQCGDLFFNLLNVFINNCMNACALLTIRTLIEMPVSM